MRIQIEMRTYEMHKESQEMKRTQEIEMKKSKEEYNIKEKA